MSWHGRLELAYRRDADRTIVLDRHDGPLRVLKSLYPEAPQVCHSVLCLLYTSPSPRDRQKSRMPSSA